MKNNFTLYLLFGWVGCFGQMHENLSQNMTESRWQIVIDSLKEALKTNKNDQRFKTNCAIFSEYITVNIDSAFIYIEKARSQAILDNDSLELVIAFNGVASLLKARGELNLAISKYEFALGIARRNEYSRQIKYLLNNLTLTNTMNASYDKALRYSVESLDLRKADGDPEEISVALNNLGYIYEEMGDLENALKNYQQSYRIKLENGIKHDFERTLINIGAILNKKGDYLESEVKLNEALDSCSEKNCSLEILLYAYSCLGINQYKQGKKIEAESYLNESLKLGRVFEMSQNGSTTLETKAVDYYWLSLINFDNNHFKKSIELLNNSQEIAKKSGMQKQISDNYGLFSRIYASLKDYKMALEYQILFSELRGEIMNGDVIRKITKLQSESLVRENQLKLKSQEEILLLQKETISQHRFLNVLIGAVALTTLAFVFILYKIILQKQNINKLLNLRVNERTHDLEESHHKLSQAHNELTLVLKKISENMHASLATLKGLAILAHYDLEEEKTVYFKEAENTTQKMMDYVDQYTSEFDKRREI